MSARFLELSPPPFFIVLFALDPLFFRSYFLFSIFPFFVLFFFKKEKSETNRRGEGRGEGEGGRDGAK